MRPHGADERAGLEPLPAQNRILGGGGRDDDVTGGRILVTLARLGAVLLAEGAQPLLRPAVGDDTLDLRDGGPDTGDLRLCLPAAADHPETPNAARGEVPGRDTARRAGAQLAELVRFDDRDELRRVGAEEEDDEASTLGEACIHLRACVTELEIGRRHHREGAALEPEPVARPILDASRRQTSEARLDRLDRVGRSEQFRDVLLREIEGHKSIVEQTQ